MSIYTQNEQTLKLVKAIAEINTEINSITENNKNIITPEMEEEIKLVIALGQKSIEEHAVDSNSITDESAQQIIDKSIHTKNEIEKIIDTAREPLDAKDMSLLMLNISRKLDNVLKNQANEKAKLSELEIKMKNNQADIFKNLTEAPLVPPKDIRLIFDTLRLELKSIIDTLEKGGLGAFTERFGKDFLKSITLFDHETPADKTRDKNSQSNIQLSC